MAQLEFYISVKGQTDGPFTNEKIATLLSEGKVCFTDYLFDEEIQDWILLSEFRPLVDEITIHKPKKPPVINQKSVAHIKNKTNLEWFIFKNEKQIGPYQTSEIIQFLQTKHLFEYDFIFRKDFEGWKRVGDVKEFTSDEIKKHVLNNIEGFSKRQFKRKPFSGQVIVHDSFQIWDGMGLEISAGGASIVMNNSFLLPLQTLNLHFKTNETLPPFNALVEIVGKQFVQNSKTKKTLTRYNVRFLKINENIKKEIFDFTTLRRVS